MIYGLAASRKDTLIGVVLRESLPTHRTCVIVCFSSPKALRLLKKTEKKQKKLELSRFPQRTDTIHRLAIFDLQWILSASEPTFSQQNLTVTGALKPSVPVSRIRMNSTREKRPRSFAWQRVLAMEVMVTRSLPTWGHPRSLTRFAMKVSRQGNVTC